MNDSAVAAAPQPSSAYRWLVLVVISLAMFGNYYIYDSIAPIADILKSDLGFSDENIGSLYSVYSIAAVAILLFGGVLVDKWGTVKSTILFGGICATAGVLNAVSSELHMMLAARTLLGIGAEPLIVAISCALAKWFKGKELAFAFGVNLTIARLGSYTADLSPTWAGAAYEGGWQPPLVIAAVIGGLCVVGAIVYGILEVAAKRKYTLGEATESDKFVLKDLFTFSRSFWLITLLCVVFYSAIFPFRSFSIKYFIEAWGLARDVAGQFNSVLPLAAMIATPIFGLMCDKLGKRALFMVFGSIILMPVYLMMAYQVVPLTVPVVMMGIAFSLIPAIMWPAVAYIVEERRLGTAYAVMFLIQQLGVAGMNWLVGRTNDAYGANAANPDGYIPMMLAFSVLGILGLIFAVMLRREETGPRGHGLETIKVS
jgi:MFS family permease